MNIKTLKYITNINTDLLNYLDLNQKDIENINKSLLGCTEEGLLNYEEGDDIHGYENLIFWINCSIEWTDDEDCLLSLNKLKYQCPEDLYWERQFAKHWQ